MLHGEDDAEEKAGVEDLKAEMHIPIYYYCTNNVY